MSKKIKPCVRCGGVERYPAKGRIGPCKACAKKTAADRANRDRDARLKGKPAKNCRGYHQRRVENMLDAEWRVRHMWSCAKSRANSKNREFDLDFEEVWSLWVRQENRCAVSGREFDLEYINGRPNPNGPSFDRIDSRVGYVAGNVRFVTYHVNTALSSFGKEELIKLYQDILENN